MPIRDGTGSDQGDTFRYECRECRVRCAGIDELCAHLLTTPWHVVCPICLQEFQGGMRVTTRGKDSKRREHIREVHTDLLNGQQRQHRRSSALDRERGRAGETAASCFDYRAISNKAKELSLEIGLPLPLPRPTDDAATATTPRSVAGNNQIEGKAPTGENKDTGPPKPKVNGVVDGHQLVPATYYHWEPDMQLVEKFGGVDLEMLREEREQEMDWLRGFEGV
ncbi:hypothetical protein PHISP_08428 [Aspergillus sp. HF37]|nr:hypothetical protein PHISP_08428 [Aspergillus sp. HF37]